jgi:hypothetical protein
MEKEEQLKTQSVVSENPVNKFSDEYKYYEKIIQRFPNQAVYIYPFSEQRMLFASGWQEVLGYDDTEVNMMLIVNSASTDLSQSLNELNNKTWCFLSTKTEKLEEYSYTFEIQRYHKTIV